MIQPFNCTFIPLSLSLIIFYPVQVKAQINKSIHKMCLKAKDYQGCIKANKPTSVRDSKRDNPYANCQLNTGRVGIHLVHTKEGGLVMNKSIDGQLLKGDILKEPLFGCPGEIKTIKIIRDGKDMTIKLSYYPVSSSKVSSHYSSFDGEKKAKTYLKELAKGDSSDLYVQASIQTLKISNNQPFTGCSLLLNNPDLIKLYSKWNFPQQLAERGENDVDSCQSYLKKFQIKSDGRRYLDMLWPFYSQNDLSKKEYLEKLKVDCLDRTFDGENDRRKWRSFDSNKNMTKNLNDVCESEGLTFSASQKKTLSNKDQKQMPKISSPLEME